MNNWDLARDEFWQFVYEHGLELRVEQHSPYHFKIKGGASGELNLWPGSKKMYKKGWVKSLVYHNLKEIIEHI